MKDTLNIQAVLKEHWMWLHGEGGKRADLSGANLRGADLRHANLWHAYLRDADLRHANLWHANLRDADLQDADLSGADLRGADLRGADLQDADLKRLVSQTQICPQDGAFTAWKKGSFGAIITLEIPADAKRLTSISSRKCRASSAVVLEITIDGIPVESCHGLYRNDFIYSTGALVIPDAFDDDPRNECSNGIHFFITREEAEDFDM